MSEKWMALRIAESMLSGLALPHFAKKVRTLKWIHVISNVIVVFLVHAQSWFF
jgi:hypothetical protein